VVNRGSRRPQCSLLIDHGHLGPYPQSFRPKISFSRLFSLLFLNHSVTSGWSFQATIGPVIRWATLFLAPLSFIIFRSSHKLPSQIKRGNSVVLPKGWGVVSRDISQGILLLVFMTIIIKVRWGSCYGLGEANQFGRRDIFSWLVA
jgi:hypothetical protein